MTAQVLVVDDNRDAAEALATLLEPGATRCASRSTRPPRSTLARTLAAADVVLLDIGLPGMDGYELARQLRRGRADAVVLVALTGYGRDEDAGARSRPASTTTW